MITTMHFTIPVTITSPDDASYSKQSNLTIVTTGSDEADCRFQFENAWLGISGLSSGFLTDVE